MGHHSAAFIGIDTAKLRNAAVVAAPEAMAATSEIVLRTRIVFLCPFELPAA